MAIIVLTRVTRYNARSEGSGERPFGWSGVGPRVKNAAGIRCTWSKRDGQSMLLTEQNVRKALVVSDYTYVMAEGRIALEGPADGSADARRSGAPCSGCEKAGGTHAARRSP